MGQLNSGTGRAPVGGRKDMIRNKAVNAVCWFSLVVLAQFAASPVILTTRAAENTVAPSNTVENTVELWEFTAPWCVHCERMTPVVRNLAEQGIPVRQIPIDEYRSLGKQAGVTRLPYFLVVSNGKIVDRKVGVSDEQDLLAFYRKQLPPQVTRSNPTIIRGQQAAPRPFGRLGSALSTFADRLAVNEKPHPESTGPFGDYSPAAVVPATSAALATSTAPAATNVSAKHEDQHEDVVDRALNATVLLRIEDPEGVSLGTGTIIDVHENEALVLTCGHIFRDSQGKGAISCDLQGRHQGKDIPGQLISYNLKRDVGLVSVRTGSNVVPIQVAGPGHQDRAREPVFALGCGQGAPATVIKNQIIAVNRYDGPANLVVGGRPINGRSGGGLFSQRGRLIGVCNAADTEEDEGLYAALGPIQAELDDAGLDFVYRRANVPKRLASNTTGASPTNRIASPTAPKPQSTSPDTEVICIVRPKGSGKDAGKAYILDQPSAELLSQLSKELGKRGSHQFTGGQQRAR